MTGFVLLYISPIYFVPFCLSLLIDPSEDDEIDVDQGFEHAGQEKFKREKMALSSMQRLFYVLF